MPHLNPIILLFFLLVLVFLVSAFSGLGGAVSSATLRHEAGIVVLRQQRRGFHHRVHHRLEPVHVVLGEILQHMAGDQRLLAGMADADAHPAIIRAQRGGDGAQAILPGIAAAGLHLQLACRQVDLVMRHHQRASGNLKKRKAGPTLSPLSFM